MRRKSLLFRLVALCLFSLIAAGVLNGQKERFTEGSLRVVGADGKAVGLCPLKKTEVKAEISGFVTRVTVTQKFQNPYDRAIEAVYTFPLHNDAAVDDMTIRIGTRTVKGKIMEKQKAQATYDQAKREGKVAALLEQQRPNIFTQSVANITPNAEIEVLISYAQTLKYSDDTYEFRFPMTIGERYIPLSINAADAARVSPGSKRRPGHTISMEVILDAGVPVQNIVSTTHVIASQQLTASEFAVRLQDQEEIPNRDFVLRYKTAGTKIQDTILAHKAGKDGFFTLILQPPDKVFPQDRMPKEIVFVLDTSGSMDGRPIRKAKEAMNLTLDDLLPGDTFNLITFAGDTRVLFEKPIPATAENIAKARKMLNDSDSGGGTEMMRAVRAALEPSGDEGSVRIVCFMTDGLVGNEPEIIAEVQRHPNARVFAFGIGDSVNNYLLDEISREGRGEVEYVGLDDDGSAAAKRFFERIRNPLLTDISVEFEGIDAGEMLPKMIPDLFDATPVTIAGRYTKGGSGKIMLRGKMQGQPYVREIVVEFPDQTSENGVLRTLWARRKAADLMRRDLTGLQQERMQSDLQNALTTLGLEFGLLTPFTSFVAVDEQVVTDGSQTERVDVPVAEPKQDEFIESYWKRNGPPATSPQPMTSYSSGPGSAGSGGGGGVSATVTVMADSSVNTSSTSTSSVVETRALEQLVVGGRSAQSLFSLANGVTQSSDTGRSPSNALISVNGQRPTANVFTIDGADAGSGTAPNGPAVTANAGSIPMLTAAGGTNGLISLSAASEVSITSFSSAREGRTAGAQINFVSRSGTNAFHGSLFEIFGNEAFNANDTLANGRDLDRAPSRLNQFGGTFAGPIVKDKAFFFGSYEGLRHRRQGFAVSEVPDLASRQSATQEMRNLLNAFPIPNGAVTANGFAEFAASYTDPAAHDVFGLRLDFNATDKLRFTGRYNGAFSHTAIRGGSDHSLNTQREFETDSMAFYHAADYTATPSVILNARFNVRSDKIGQRFTADNLGGAVVPSLLRSSFDFLRLDLTGRNAAIAVGLPVATTTTMIQPAASVEWIAGSHHFSVGTELRHLKLNIGSHTNERSVLFQGIVADGTAARVSELFRNTTTRISFSNLSAYAQDEWRIQRRLNLTLGVRWDADIMPGYQADPIKFGDASTRLPDSFGNLAPRAAVAYDLFGSGNAVIRAGVGLYFDRGTSLSSEPYVNSYPYASALIERDTPFSASPTVTVRPLAVFAEGLATPRTWQIFAEYQHEFFDKLVFTAGYNAAFGRGLFLTRTFNGIDPGFPYIRSTDNSASSNYHAASVRAERRFSGGFSFNTRYTFARATDNHSPDAFGESFATSVDLRSERGASDHDARHTLVFNGTYDLPRGSSSGWAEQLTRDWSVSGRANARSALPVNVTYYRAEDIGVSMLRPDYSPGGAAWVSSSSMPAIDRSAFVVPAAGQGTLGRNAFRGFPFTQIDLRLERRFRFAGESGISLALEMFNVFNTTNFADPDASLGTLFPTGTFVQNHYFGRTTETYGGRSFAPFYLYGGPRTLQLSAKLDF